MTCREKLAIEHPDKVRRELLGGCIGCTYDYDYMPRPEDCCQIHASENPDKICKACWDREIPEEKKTIGEALSAVAEAAKNIGWNLNAVNEAIDTPHILDSGNRREFETGAVRDIQEGKGRCDLLPLDVVSDFLEDTIIEYICKFQKNGHIVYLYSALKLFAFNGPIDRHNMFDEIGETKRHAHWVLEVSKHFEEGCKKYGENNWQKGIPVRCYIDSAVRHYLKFLRGDKDEPHDRAFCWNILCAIWTCKHKPELNDYAKSEIGEAINARKEDSENVG